MHLYKVKATLSDYFDLNMRYIRTTNCITFKNEKVEMDIVPSLIFNNIKNQLLNIIDIPSNDLMADVSIEKICDDIIIDDEKFIAIANIRFNKIFNDKNEILLASEDIKYEKFNKNIDEMFTKDKLIEMLEWFENRDDKNIQNYIKCEADIPTIFEYVVGIIWYIVSERKGKILDFMRLSLDADLLPRTHATGGGADIVYEYECTSFYPKHTMLLEMSLAENTGQRVLEMESVSRHLGEHMIRSNNKNDYCTFISLRLNPNLISDYRVRKNIVYYDIKGQGNNILGMKIIPFETKILKRILQKGYTYKNLYKIFEDAYNASEEPKEWYKKNIEEVI